MNRFMTELDVTKFFFYNREKWGGGGGMQEKKPLPFKTKYFVVLPTCSVITDLSFTMVTWQSGERTNCVMWASSTRHNQSTTWI